MASNERQLFITLLIIILTDFTKETKILSDFKTKSMTYCVQKVPNTECFVQYFQYFDQKYRSNDLINYSINCKNIESHQQINDTIDWVHKNNETICEKKYSKTILKAVHFLRSDSSAIIQSINYFDKTVESISISDSFLSEIPHKLFELFTDLKHLNLSFNNLTHFSSKSLFSTKNGLISLDLSHNSLVSIELNNLYSLESLHISDNQLKSIAKFDHKFKSISLANNQWNCDNQLIWLLMYITSESHNIVNKDKIRCKYPESAEGMTFGQRLFVLESPVCGQCECSLLQKQGVMSVNCSDKGLDSLPASLPSMTKIVRLDNNNIKNISISLMGLNDWRNVTYLHLNNNTIESFVGLERTDLLKSLVALNMSHNRLREIPVYILDQLSHLDELYLSENPWRCDCKTVVFKDWLQRHFKSVKDVYNIRCGGSDPHSTFKPKNGLYSEDFDNKYSNRVLLRIPKPELCPQSRDPIDVLELINWLLSIAILLIIIKLIYDYFWQKRTGKLPQFFKVNI